MKAKQNEVVSNKYWIKVVVLFTIGWALMYANRNILNPVQPIIAKEFGLSNSQLGLMSSLFFLVYAILQIPGGILGDKFGRKGVVSFGFIFFGIATALTGFSNAFIVILIARMLVGFGEGFYYGPQYALSSEAIPKNKLTMGTAIINSGMALGISGGYMLSSKVVLQDGAHWSTPFFIMSVPTIIVGILFYVLLKERVIRPEDKDIASETTTKAAKAQEKISFKEIIKNKNLIFTFIMCFCSLYGFFVINTWLPQFLQVERGYKGTQVGFISSLVPWASIPGALLFGYLADKFKSTKKLVFILVPLAAISIIAVAYVQNRTLLIIALICYGLFGKLALDPILVSFTTKQAPKAGLATTLSIYNFVGMSSSILSPYITGAISDSVGSMKVGFFIAGILLLVGLFFMSLVKESDTVNV